jgi:hypothetical protein
VSRDRHAQASVTTTWWCVARVGLAIVLLGPGCAPYLAPAASTSGFFSSPFRALAPEAEAEVHAKLGPAPKKARASARAVVAAPPPVLAVTGAGPDAPLPPSVLGDPPPPAPSLKPAAMVEGTLRKRGVRFGTDGTVSSLFTYMRIEQALVPPRSARAGDVLFFNITGDGGDCADHAGVVEAVEDGRIAFKEVRDGQVRTSYVDPLQPSLRRSPDGRIINSFLRPRRTDDPPEARYFAGEMLCAVGRVRR